MKPPLPNLSLGRLLNRSDLAALPKPQPLIENWVDLRTTSLVVGATGTNKTFMLLGWACSVATGMPWLGNTVTVSPAPVIYVAGEGGSGLDGRIGAWEADHGVAVPDNRFTVSLQPYSLNSETFWEELCDTAMITRTRLVVLDTFSSLAPEADETKDAASVLRYMSETAQAIDGAVVLAHHTGWGPQDRSRGASQFEANIDSTIILKKLDADDDNSPVEVWRKKNKDGPEGRRLHVHRRTSADSCVLECIDAPASAKRGGGGSAAISDAVKSVLCSDDPFTQTRENVIAKVGGDKMKVRRVLTTLLEQSIVVEEHRPRTEGARQVSRDVLAWNNVERVVVPMTRAKRRTAGEAVATPPDTDGGVGGVAGHDPS